MSGQTEHHEDSDIALAPERPAIKPPRQFCVLLINDDFTPMDFVVEILMGIFTLPPSKAASVMLEVHEKGLGVAGVYSREIAETKIAQVHAAAAKSEHPLRCDIRPA